MTSSSFCFKFTPNVCGNINFRISGTFQNGKEKVKQRDDLCVLSENQKIFMIGFDLLYPGQYKVVVKFSNNQVTNSPFKFQVSSKVEMKDFKTVFTEIDKHEVESVLVKQVKDQLRTKLEDQTSTAIHHHPPYVTPTKGVTVTSHIKNITATNNTKNVDADNQPEQVTATNHTKDVNAIEFTVANQTQEVTAENKTNEVTSGTKIDKVTSTISELKPLSLDSPSRSNLSLRCPVESSVSISTISTVKVSSVGTTVLTKNKTPVTYHYKALLTTDSLSSVCSPLTSRPMSSIQPLKWSPLSLVTDVAARTEPFRSSIVIKNGTDLDELYRPIGLCLLNNGNLVVASTFEDKVKLFLAVAVQHSLLKELIQMEKDKANMLSRLINYSFESLEPCSSRFVEDNCIKCGNELEFISTLDTILLYKSFLTLTDVLCVRCQYSE